MSVRVEAAIDDRFRAQADLRGVTLTALVGPTILARLEELEAESEGRAPSDPSASMERVRAHLAAAMAELTAARR